MTVNMDTTSDEHSPPLSEQCGSSWLHWENEISSLSGLNLDGTPELNGMVEDKEVAARAVALVVNSTRKGIVPLCADIANLLRAKRSLEKKVYLLKREVEALRSSTSVSFRTSHSTSPTPPLGDKMTVMDLAFDTQDRSRPCSRCSQCSSTMSNPTNKADGSSNGKMYLFSPLATRDTLRKMSPRMLRQINKPPHNGVASGPPLVQSLSCETNAAVQLSSPPPSNLEVCSSISKRKNSLPEMTSEPCTEILRINPKISKEIQCNMPLQEDFSFEGQLFETVHLNAKQAEELGSARKEIEILKGRLKELEMNQLARVCTQEHYRCETELEDMAGSYNPSPGSFDSKNSPSSKGVTSKQRRATRSHGLSHSKSQSSSRSPHPQGSLLYAEPLYGCKCTACEEAMGSEIHAVLSSTLNEDLQKFPINSNVRVQLGDHVVTKGEKTGRIRYIGHLDNIGQPNMVFVGLELDAPVGHHDGFCNNKRYFFCQRDHGIFFPLHDIICKVGCQAASDKGDEGGDFHANSFVSFARSTSLDMKDTGNNGKEIILLSKSQPGRHKDQIGSVDDRL